MPRTNVRDLDDDELDAAFYDYIDSSNMMGPDNQGRVVFRELHKRFNQCRYDITRIDATAEVCEKATKWDELMQVLGL